jgi:hypothetical protein
MTSLYMSAEPGEGTVPHRHAWVGTSHRAFNAIGFLATAAPVD